MSKIDRDIKFWLTEQGWHIDDIKIEMIDHIDGVNVYVDGLDSKMLAYNENGKIFLSRALSKFGTLPQKRLAILHELCHIKHNLEHLSPHEEEYECDRWALQQMIDSGHYTASELMSAIRIFVDISNNETTKTHPASHKRYKRLYRQLEEYVL